MENNKISRKECIKIVIASGKGGTGKTLIATNFFDILHKAGYPVQLIDCDAEEPNDTLFIKGKLAHTKAVFLKVPVIDANRCTFCGKCSEYCHYNAIFIVHTSESIKVIEDLCHGCSACSVACAYGAISEKDVLIGHVNQYSIDGNATLIEGRMRVGVYSPVNIIKAALKEAGDKEIQIVDAPPGTSCPFIQSVANADYVVLVAEPTPFGLSDLKQSVETLKSLHKTYGVIINRADIGNMQLVHYLKKEKIKMLMKIPFDKAIAASYAKGEMVSLMKPEWEAMFLSMFNLIHQERWK